MWKMPKFSESPFSFFWGFFFKYSSNFFCHPYFISGSGAPVLPWISEPCYPTWAFEKVKQQMESGKQKSVAKQKGDGEKCKGMVVIPYVKGTSEIMSRLYKSYDIASAMKSHTTLRMELVHQFIKFLDIRYFTENRSKNHFSTSISCRRGLWGPFWTFENFDQKFSNFLTFVISPKIDLKDIFLHRYHVLGASGTLFRHSKILTKNFWIF